MKKELKLVYNQVKGNIKFMLDLNQSSTTNIIHSDIFDFNKEVKTIVAEEINTNIRRPLYKETWRYKTY